MKMKWFSLLAAAAFLAWGPTAHADPVARPTAAQPDASYPPGYAVPVATSADIDFPDYPPGFSSYRGLGFMGRCCEPCSPVAQRAWDGYCEGNECCEPAPCHSFFEKLHCRMYRPEWAGASKGGDPCGGPGANCRPLAPSCHEPLCFKLQRLRAQWAGMIGGCGKAYYDPGVEDGKALEPTKGQTQKFSEPIPEPAVPEAPAPRATGEIRPDLPSPPTMDRSARRLPPWQLPVSRSGL
jgi:hypothetical protein